MQLDGADLPIGAHQSIAGGTPRAVERGVAAGCRVLQIFVKNNNRWVGKTIEEAEAREFRRAARQAGLARVAAHTSYLINLASPSGELRPKFLETPKDESLDLDRKNLATLRRLAAPSPDGEGRGEGTAETPSA